MVALEMDLRIFASGADPHPRQAPSVAQAGERGRACDLKTLGGGVFFDHDFMRMSALAVYSRRVVSRFPLKGPKSAPDAGAWRAPALDRSKTEMRGVVAACHAWMERIDTKGWF
jgi:hypothetical protein